MPVREFRSRPAGSCVFPALCVLRTEADARPGATLAQATRFGEAPWQGTAPATRTIKKGPCGPSFVSASRPRSHRGGGVGVGPRLLHRAGIQALGIDVTLDELDHCDRRVVAVAKARLHNAGIAAVAVLVARTQHVEQLLHHGNVANLRDRLAPRMQAAAISEIRDVPMVKKLFDVLGPRYKD